MENLVPFFDTNGFMPHGHCFLWTPGLLWLYVLSDSVIALSYYSIPFALWYFVRKRPDFPFRWILVMFGVFVMACGTTHLFAMWNIWNTNYWGDAMIKTITATASIVTAIMLWPLIPRAIAMPSPQQLADANLALQLEIKRRTAVESELRHLNQDLEQRSAQLEAANKELESFGYAVSHDLRAPLRAIHGFSEILTRHYRDQLNDKGRHFLDNIITAATDMNALIDELLSYSRLGYNTVKLQVVDMNLLMAQIASNFEIRVSEIGADLVVPSELPKLLSDWTLLNQILSNLIDNAYTYRRTGVKLRIDVSVRETSNQWIICVADNGIGIASDQLERIFLVFQRLHNVDEYPGTGIGLALVRKAAKVLGGDASVESEVGRGSTFYVRLPKNPSSGGENAPMQEKA